MEKWVDDLLTEEIKNEICRKLGVEIGSLKKLGDFENYVFSCRRSETLTVLRITHSSHRSYNDIIAELKWLEFLLAHNVSVVNFIQAESSDPAVEAEAGDSSFIGVLFEMIPGKIVEVRGEEPEIIEKWGEITGKIQSVSREYNPKEKRYERFHWLQDDLNSNFKKYIPEDEEWAIERFSSLIDHFQKKKRTAENYGMIHRDIHNYNFHLHNGDLTVFDFDDCCRGFYLFDPVISLFHTLEHFNIKRDDGEFIEYFMKNFLKGYGRYMALSVSDLEEFHSVLNMRKMEIYTVLVKKFQGHDLDNKQREWLDNFTNNLKNEERMSDYDFSRLKRFL